MPFLFVKHGPNAGEQFLLDKPTLVLGRDTEICDIALLAPKPPNPKMENVISKRHAVITRQDDRYYIADGDGNARPSHNQTWVNDTQLLLPGRRLLKDGDLIRICYYTLVFHDGVTVPVEDDSDSSSINLSIGAHDSSIFLAQPAETLRWLMEISKRLSKTRELDAMLPEVVEILLQLFKQADRTFLIQVNEATGRLDARIFKTRGAATESRFPAGIVKECLKTGEGVLSLDRADGSGAGRSAICAPLADDEGKAFAVLLADTTNAGKPFSAEDLQLLMGVASQASIVLANARFHHDALLWEAYKRDLALARDVVKSFLPERLPEIAGYEFFASYESALEVGGDYYDFIELPGQRLAIMVGDVSGKGVPAALVMARFSAQAQACLRTEKDLASAVRQLNSLMQSLGLTDKFITLVVLVLDPATHTITFVNAGHPAPMWSRRGAAGAEDINRPVDGGPPVGVVDGFAYQAHQLTLQPGDRLVLFSDGVDSAMDVHGSQLSLAGLRATIAAAGNATPRELGEKILQAIETHAAGCKQFDDITLVCFGRP